MSKSTQTYLQDLVEHLDKLLIFTQDGRQAFEADEKTQFAVIRAYEVIGEIVKRLPSGIREENSQIDWRKLAGFRDFLSHNYDEIILEFVWQAVEDVPRLRAETHAILDKLSDDDVTASSPD